MGSEAAPILIAGGGIAGLTAALAFAAEGYRVHVFERAPEFQEIGAGVQLSPNATHILGRLSVLDHLLAEAVFPQSVVLRDARSLRKLVEIPLGNSTRPSDAPYLTTHRAALLRALLKAVTNEPAIVLRPGIEVVEATLGSETVTLTLDHAGQTETAIGAMFIAADGVWSRHRGLANKGPGESEFSGLTAWRITLSQSLLDQHGLDRLLSRQRVSTFLDPRGHLVAYPVSAGNELNVVVITRGNRAEPGWSYSDDRKDLDAFLARFPTGFSSLQKLGGWTRWPLYAAPESLNWTASRFALIGDAAHAMLPFAAQGAAMAIEDAAVLARRVAQAGGADDETLTSYENERRARLARVVSRGRLNKLAWHAAGPIALGRDLVFKLKGGPNLAADLAWLYDWREPRARL